MQVGALPVHEEIERLVSERQPLRELGCHTACSSHRHYPSRRLESKDIIVSSAERGAIAIELLKKNPDIDLVLMDIMMPDMDGYETMREIRKIDSLKQLPIISLTAKAMVGDKEKCLEAGASDYLSKPVNIVQLTSMMQVWLSKESVKSV